ncbi:MAG: hypothetical protein ACTSWI_07140, partial [Alphaproteobacteria bacterium]
VSLCGIIALAILFSSRLRRSDYWRATVTPLASIIGSGFLVAPPLLAANVGDYALLAMAALVGVAYLIGEAVRFNIRYTEPLLAGLRPDRLVLSVERLSHFALVFAYFISVTYYLLLLSNFLLKGFGIVSPNFASVMTTVILVGLGLLGLLRGLRALESLEKYAVSIKLAIIAGLLTGMAFFNVDAALQGVWSLHAEAPEFSWNRIQVLLGLLIVVQGFETSRFLGDAYSPGVRISTMRMAQGISAVIYLAFFALVTVLIRPGGAGIDHGEDVTGIIDIVRTVATLLPLLLIVAALASQFSAAIADMIGGAGLIEEISHRQVNLRHAYPLIAVAGIALVWSANVFEIITFASQAFALFYFLQCGIAAIVAWKQRDVSRRLARIILYAVTATICLCVVMFGIPSSA